MLRSGPIPFTVHGVVEYLAAVAFIAAPTVLDFSSDLATTLSRVVGVVVLLVALTTVGRTSVVDLLPLRVHVALDYILGAALVVAPFVFSFTEDGAATAWFVALGCIHLVMTQLTAFPLTGEVPVVGGIAEGTPDDAAAGERTVVDDARRP